MTGRTTNKGTRPAGRQTRVAGQRIIFAEWAEELRATKGVTLEMPDGEVYVLDPPELWSDDVQKALIAGDLFQLSEAVIGADRMQKFLASGGSARLIDRLIADLASDMRVDVRDAMQVGESSASSRS